MIKKFYKVTQILAFVPFMAIPSISVASNFGPRETCPVIKEEVSIVDTPKARGKGLDTY